LNEIEIQWWFGNFSSVPKFPVLALKIPVPYGTGISAHLIDIAILKIQFPGEWKGKTGKF
jgi:hypothetical protein